MSKSNKKTLAKVTRPETSEDVIAESFERALVRGEVTDTLGNPISPEEFMEVDPKWNTREFVVGTVHPQMSHLQGKVLTLIDATYDDKERAKYVKDLIKDVFVTQADCILQIAIDCENA